MSTGFWIPHSSSIDFCEPDYILTNLVAEPFNAASSLFIAFLGLCGILYSNPTNEKMFTSLFFLLIVVGLGSVALHTTLHWFPQSLDEVPMLWVNINLIYVLFFLHLENSTFVSNLSGIFMLLATAIITYIYYSLRQYYVAFLVVMISSSAIVIFWSVYIVFFDGKDKGKLIKSLWKWSIISFLGFGFLIWILDMQLCSQLLPFYVTLKGLTFHIVWHFAAGYGAYLQVLLLIAARCFKLDKQLELVWKFGIIPALQIIEKKKK
jgi:dihydroceramidase